MYLFRRETPEQADAGLTRWVGWSGMWCGGGDRGGGRGGVHGEARGTDMLPHQDFMVPMQEGAGLFDMRALPGKGG